MDYRDDIFWVTLLLGFITITSYSLLKVFKKHGLLQSLYIASLIGAPIIIIRILFTGIPLKGSPAFWVYPGVLLTLIIPLVLKIVIKRRN